MPEVRLTCDEEDGDLPPVCMCCGEAATTFIDRSFLLQEPVVRGPSVFWEIYLARLLFASAAVPRFRVRTSFCQQHRHYWLLRFALGFGGVAGLLAVVFGGLAFMIFLIAVAKIDAPWVPALVIVPLILYVIAWLIPIKLVMPRSIRARRTADGGVELQNVGQPYIAAIEARRQRPALPFAVPMSAIAARPARAAVPAARPRDDRKTPAPPRPSSNLVLWLVLGGVGSVVLLGMLAACAGIGLTMMTTGATETAKTPAAQGANPAEKDKPLAENERPDPPGNPPLAVDSKLLQGEGKVYLTDMQEFAWKPGGYPGWDRLGKNGHLGDPNDPNKLIKVNGASYAKGLAMLPNDHGYTRVCYALGKRAKSLGGGVAFSEAGGIGLGPVRFVVLGDGKVLWRSKVVRELRVVEEFTVDVSQVQVLELRVYAQEGNNWSSHAAWLDPYVTAKQ